MATEQQLLVDLKYALSDDDPEKNLLNGKKAQYAKNKLRFFLQQSLRDLNRGTPKTSFGLETFPDDAQDLLIRGAVIQAMISEGLLQLRNQVDYSDSGLSINLFNKTGGYQQWAGFFLQTYLQDKLEWKRGLTANSTNIFYGIASGFHPESGNRY